MSLQTNKDIDIIFNEKIKEMLHFDCKKKKKSGMSSSFVYD